MFKALVSFAGIVTLATLPTVSGLGEETVASLLLFIDYWVQVDAEAMTPYKKAYMEKVVSRACPAGHLLWSDLIGIAIMLVLRQSFEY